MLIIGDYEINQQNFRRDYLDIKHCDEARNRVLSSYPPLFSQKKYYPNTKTLFPIIKLKKWITYNPEEYVGDGPVVIKAQQLLSKDGKSTTKLFDQIQDDGGIHNHLDSDNDVILSSIMPDRAIAGLTCENFAEMIDTMGVEYYLTPDGETYLGEAERSAFEITRMLDQTQTLLDLCPRCVPIGLVKGCTSDQVRCHTENLQNLGIQRFCFHLGDFFRGSDSDLITARRFAVLIRERTKNLIIYGIGSRKYINMFRFADGFATQSHYAKAYLGYRYEGRRWVHAQHRDVNRELIMHNLCAINSFVNDLSCQQELIPFSEGVDCVRLQNSIREQTKVDCCINN